jgi:hypothetical protein
MFIPGAFAVPTDLSMTVEETVLLSAACVIAAKNK